MRIWEQKGGEVSLTLIEVVLVGGGGWYVWVWVTHNANTDQQSLTHTIVSQSNKLLAFLTSFGLLEEAQTQRIGKHGSTELGNNWAVFS